MIYPVDHTNTSGRLQKKESRAAMWFTLSSMLSTSCHLQKKASRAAPWLISCLCYLWAAPWLILLSMSTPSRLSPEESVQTCATIYSLYHAIFIQLCPETKAPWASLWYLRPALSRKEKKMAKAAPSSTSGSIQNKNMFRPVPGFIPLSMLSTSSSVQKNTARAISWFSLLSSLSVCGSLWRKRSELRQDLYCPCCLCVASSRRGPKLNHDVLSVIQVFGSHQKKVARTTHHDLTTCSWYLHLNYPRRKWPELYTTI